MPSACPVAGQDAGSDLERLVRRGLVDHDVVATQKTFVPELPWLLDELRVELRFCLPAANHDALMNAPPRDVDAFTGAVFAPKAWIRASTNSCAALCVTRSRADSGVSWTARRARDNGVPGHG